MVIQKAIFVKNIKTIKNIKKSLTKKAKNCILLMLLFIDNVLLICGEDAQN